MTLYSENAGIEINLPPREYGEHLSSRFVNERVFAVGMLHWSHTYAVIHYSEIKSTTV